MKNKFCALVFWGVVVVTAASGARGGTRSHTHTVAPSHVAILRRTFGKTKVVVRLRTIALRGEWVDACPVTRGLFSGQPAAKGRLTVAQNMDISVAARSVYVSALVYATLTNPRMASLSRDRKGYVLRIDGDAGTDSSAYFVLVHFNSEQVDEVKFYSNLDPYDPLSATAFMTSG